MFQSLLTKLRDKKTKIAEFRRAAHEVAHLLAQKTAEYVQEDKVTVQTPLKKTKGTKLKKDIVLIVVLRSSAAFLPVFLEYFEDARVGFVGMHRDEKTAIAHEYFRNIPKIKKDTQIIIFDPMLATGGTAVDTLKILKEMGAQEKQIIFTALISASQGERYVKKYFPKIRLIVGVQDEKLNAKSFILPGLGDFGDRYFGT